MFVFTQKSSCKRAFTSVVFPIVLHLYWNHLFIDFHNDPKVNVFLRQGRFTIHISKLVVDINSWLTDYLNIFCTKCKNSRYYLGGLDTTLSIFTRFFEHLRLNKVLKYQSNNSHKNAFCKNQAVFPIKIDFWVK